MHMQFSEMLIIYSAVKNYPITCSNRVVCSFSASLDFRKKQSLSDYMCSSMLYPVMKSDSSILILSLRKQMFAEIGQFLAVKNYRINIIVSLFSNQNYFSFAGKSHIQRKKFLLNIFIKK